MRKPLLYTAVLLTVFCSCKKDSILSFQDDPSITSVYGTWKLISRENYYTNEVFYKQTADVQGYCNSSRACDIILTFSKINSENKISGHTITNEVYGEFTFDQAMRHFNIVEFGGTKIGEPMWSDNIWKNINHIESYKINGQFLRLYLDNKPESLTFERQ
jgi:hypothetical protein